MFDSVLGLTVSFLLLAVVTSWNTVKVRGSIWVKFFSITFLIWYGLVVYFTIPKMMGWPILQDVPPNVKIVGIKIKEPCLKDRVGAIYFWTSEKPNDKKEFKNLIRPDRFFLYTGSEQPRAYKIPYDKELHKKIIETKRKQQKLRGSVLLTGEKGIKKSRGTREQFKIKNYLEMIPKEAE